MKEQGFVLAVVLGVGGFLGPRLMGFSGLLDPSQLRSLADAQKKRRQRIMIHFFAGLGLIASFGLEGSGRFFAAYVLRALVVTAELLWTTSILHFPAAKELFARLLWFALWMVILGYWGAALFLTHRKEMLHMVYIGGFSFMIFSVATMVILSHAGEGEKLKKPLWVLYLAAVCVPLAFVLRLTASFFPEYYFNYLAAASACWLIAGLGWLGFIAPKLMRRRDAESKSC